MRRRLPSQSSGVSAGPGSRPNDLDLFCAPYGPAFPARLPPHPLASSIRKPPNDVRRDTQMTTAADRSLDTAAGLNEADVHQEFGENPNEVRDTDHYTEEYIKGFIDKWDDYIGW